VINVYKMVALSCISEAGKMGTISCMIHGSQDLDGVRHAFGSDRLLHPFAAKGQKVYIGEI